MGKNLKTAILAICLAILVSAIFAERHEVLSLVPGKKTPKNVNGFQYIETASVDGLMRKDGNIYDIYSLTPEVLQQKDCPT